MSGIFAVHGGGNGDFELLAARLIAQVSSGSETLRCFARDEHTLMGISTHDHLRKGPMPCWFKAEEIWVLLEGTLYPPGVAHALKALGEHDPRNDAELFAALHRRGLLEKALPDLNGAFFAVLWDPRQRVLTACNDRFGLYPNYGADNGKRFCLGSRILCSVLARVVPGEWDSAGVAQLLTTGDYSGDLTSLREVWTFPQASIMTKRDGYAPVFKTYWRYDYTPRLEGAPLAEIGEQLGHAFIESVRRQTAGFERIGVTLSGGLDSRCIAAALHQLEQPLVTMTFGKPGALDRKYAQTTAKQLAADHHDNDYLYGRIEDLYIEFGQTTECLSDLIDANMLAHVDLFANHAGIILNGYAGDVILGGSFLRSRWMRELPVKTLAERLFQWRNTAIPESQLASAISQDAVLDEDDLPSRLYERLLEQIDIASTPDKVDCFFLENRQRRNTAMGTVLMRREVESAASFFDYDFVNLVTAVPARLREHHRAYIAMMKSALPASLTVPWQRTLMRPGAPVAMALGAKALLKALRILEARLGVRTIASAQSFTEYDSWFRGPLKAFAHRICADSYPVADEILQPSFCEGILAEHLAGANRSGLIGIIASIRSFSLALERARKGETAASYPSQELTQFQSAD